MLEVAAAESVVSKLDAAGLSDYYVHKMPAGKRRVFLGIYNSKRFANKRLQELKDAGIKAFSRPSKASGFDFFLVIRGHTDEANEALVARLPVVEGNQAKQQSFCDQIASR